MTTESTDTPPIEGEQPPPTEPEAPPPPPEQPAEPVTFEPATWYEVTSVCCTENMGNGNPCPNLNTTTTEPMVYSNAGTVTMICGLCGQERPILAATKLDPQPEMS
jgi:hypothetical protein